MEKKYCAIIGNPVAHSLSPQMFAFWFKKYNISAEYLSFSLEEKNFYKVINTLPFMNFVGVNITMPFKKMAYEICDTYDDMASSCQSINALHFLSGKTHGMTTDGFGFLSTLEKHHHCDQLSQQSLLIMGAGGASRSICTALLHKNPKKLTITNRSQDRSEQLVADLRIHFPHANIDTLAWEEKGSLNIFDGLINTTCLGMKNTPSHDISFDNVPKHFWVFDIVYRPLKTSLIIAALEKKIFVMDGLDMLIYQALPCFESWFGFEPGFIKELRLILENEL